MDFSAFATAPVIAASVILVIIGALAGYLAGSTRESGRKEAALKEAGEEKAAALASMTEAHQKLVDSVKEGHLREIEQTNQQHGGLIAQLNDTNLSNTKELRQEYDQRVDRLKQENGETVQALERKHRAQLDQIEAENQAGLTKLRMQITELNEERSRLRESVAELEDRIKEDRKNNTFSMSKSGSRLMSVVRSVQELANELETTSKTVTAGEYSVFSELRDNRKQEKILSLGDGESSEEEPGTEAEKGGEAVPETAETTAEAATAGGATADRGEEPVGEKA